MYIYFLGRWKKAPPLQSLMNRQDLSLNILSSTPHPSLRHIFYPPEQILYLIRLIICSNQWAAYIFG